MAQLEKRVKDNPGDVQAAFNLASAYLQMQQTNNAYQVLDRALEKSQTNVGALLAIAQAWAQLGNYGKLESTLEKLSKAAPDSPEAWYDLAAVKATLNKPTEAIPALKQALETSSKRLAQDSKARDLRTELKQDPRFAAMSALPEFQKLTESP
jgi:tetratricopeptide (TPR) repeat protein